MKEHIGLLIILLGGLVGPPFSDSPGWAGPGGRQASENEYDTDLSVRHLEISLRTDFQSNSVSAVVEAAVENTSRKAVDTVEFWLCPGGLNDPDFGADVKHIYLLEDTARKDLPFTIRKIDDTWESCRVVFPSPVQPGDKLSLQFEYTMTGKPDHSSSPIMMSGGGIKEIYLRGGDYLWCPEPYYDLNQMHVSRRVVRPSWTLRMEYPAGYVAVTNGELRRRVERDGRVTDEWTSLSLLPGTPYLYVGPYKVAKRDIDGLTFEMYAPDEELLKQVAGRFELYARTFRFYSELYGEPAHPTYRIVGSALENVGNSFTTGQFVNMRSLDDPRLIAHEMSHIWWGGTVSPKGAGWKFLTEAMAEFSEEWVLALLGEEHDERLTDSNILAAKQNYVCPYLPVPYTPKRMGQGPLLFQEGQNPNWVTNANYNWGPVVVNQIRCILGDEIFFKCLRAYLDEFRGKRPGIEDFIQTINTVSGTDLTSDLEGLLGTTGFASYHVVSFESQPAEGGFRTKVRIGNAGDYGLTCPLLLKTLSGQKREMFNVQAKQEKEFVFRTTHRVVEVVIDPDSTTLQYHPQHKVRMFMALRGSGNWEWYGKAYMYYALGEYEEAVDTISDYLHRSMRRSEAYTVDELLAKSGMDVGYVFMRGVFQLGLGQPTLAEQDIKRAFGYMLGQMVGENAVRAPEMYYWLGAIEHKDLGEYLELLSLIAGREFAFESGLDYGAKRKKVEQWQQWWEKEGRQKKLDLDALREKCEARRRVFRQRESLLTKSIERTGT